MILIDDRTGSKELIVPLNKLGIPTCTLRLEYGDACFEGNGPEGVVSIGVERKALSDMLNCIDDARYSATQLPGMKALYNLSFLCVEGRWEPQYVKDAGAGIIYTAKDSGSWYPYTPFRGARPVLYAKLYRYLLSLQLAGVMITLSHNLYHTAYNIAEIYQYFQKPWKRHNALREVQKIHLPTMTGNASLTHRWAANLDGVGVELSESADSHFNSAYDMANADESDWIRVSSRIGARRAMDIVKQIRRRKK